MAWHDEQRRISGHTQRLRSGDLGTLMRTGYHRTMEYVQAHLEQLGFDDVRPAHMAIFQNLGPEGARIGSWQSGPS
jgi:hypothetical protein